MKKKIKIILYFYNLNKAPAVEGFIILSFIIVINNFIIGFTLEKIERGKIWK